MRTPGSALPLLLPPHTCPLASVGLALLPRSQAEKHLPRLSVLEPKAQTHRPASLPAAALPPPHSRPLLGSSVALLSPSASSTPGGKGGQVCDEPRPPGLSTHRAPDVSEPAQPRRRLVELRSQILH